MDDPSLPNNDAALAALTNTAVVSLASAVNSEVFLPIVGMMMTGHVFILVLSHR